MPDEKPTLDYGREPVPKSGWGCILKAMLAMMVFFILLCVGVWLIGYFYPNP